RETRPRRPRGIGRAQRDRVALRRDRREGAGGREGGRAHAPGQAVVSDRSAFESDWRAVSSPAARSPCSRTRTRTASIVNAAGSSASPTSSQRSGVDTGAPGCGRTEYVDAIVLPSPFWFASINTPRRRAFDHSVVASFGCVRTIAPATISAKRRVSAYVERRSSGTRTWKPLPPDVLG